MNKVILISETECLPDGAFEFACMLNEQRPILLTGISLPGAGYGNTRLYYSLGIANSWLFLRENEPVLIAEEAENRFKKCCIDNRIEFCIHEMHFRDIKKVLKIESRFTNRMIVSNNSLYDDFEAGIEQEYEAEVIYCAECLVVIVTEVFHEPQKIILTYEGNASSVFTIRQFASLMPELTRLEPLLVCVNSDNGIDFPDKDDIEKLRARLQQSHLMKPDIGPRTML